jgi:hypothetical protein
MSKRKRDEAADTPSNGDPSLSLKISRLRAKIGQGVKVLHNALKLARGFERQKLGRRQKNASDDPKTLLRLREEVIVLKQLDLEKTARSQLHKTLLRTKRVCEHAAFIGIYGPNPSSHPVKPGAEANVVARLFNSAPVKKVLSEVLQSIYHVLGLPQIASGNARESRKTGEEPTGAASQLGASEDFEGFSDEDTDLKNDGERRVPPLPDDNGSDDESDDAILDYADRLASSEEDSDNDSLDIPIVSSRTGNRQEDLSLSPSGDEISQSEERALPTRSTQPQKLAKTAFLPSLSLGGYYSGSESGEGEPDYRGPALPKPRKNRRGQQARRMLAELKHGKNAKHLSKQPQKDRNSGWDAKRGAVGDTQPSRGRGRDSHTARVPRDDHATAFSRKSVPTARKSRDDSGPIHPSWEAAKKRKTQDQAQASFQGKKTTFD